MRMQFNSYGGRYRVHVMFHNSMFTRMFWSAPSGTGSMHSRRWLHLTAVLVFHLLHISHSQEYSNTTPFSKDFLNFMNEISSVITGKELKAHDSKTTSDAPEPTESPAKESELREAQNSMLKDVLMLKLISYYENKYELQTSTLGTSREDHTAANNAEFGAIPYYTAQDAEVDVNKMNMDDNPQEHRYDDIDLNDNSGGVIVL